jgi:pSer/pThr/pTyr-binding forkhead associated (FHA) protein
MTSQLYLEVVAGPDQGQRYPLMPGTYRVIGRAPHASDTTTQMTRDGDRALDPDSQRMVDNAFQRSRRPVDRVRSHRRRAADVELHDDGVSRSHAMVFLDEHGQASLVDLMSTNGTQLNGETIQDADLQPGDVISVGATRLALAES